MQKLKRNEKTLVEIPALFKNFSSVKYVFTEKLKYSCLYFFEDYPIKAFNYVMFISFNLVNIHF